MIETIVWPFTVIVIATFAIWQGRRLLRPYVQAQTIRVETVTRDLEVTLLEKETQQQIDTMTVEDAAALQSAKLQQERANVLADTELTSQLTADRLAAQRTLIAERTKVQVAQLPETVSQAGDVSGEELVNAWRQYLEVTDEFSLIGMSFDDFVQTLNQHAN